MSKICLELKKSVHPIRTFRTLDKTISSLEVQLAAARAAKGDSNEGSPMVTKPGIENLKERPKLFFVMGIITAFSSRKRRDSIRETWMPQGLIQYCFGILLDTRRDLVNYLFFEVYCSQGRN